MENSQSFGSAEEFSSSESGWTTYLASPIRGDGDDVGEGEGEGVVGHEDDWYVGNNSNRESKGDEEDDSMASDASSGPARCKQSYEKSHGKNVMGHLKHQEDDDNGQEQESCSQYSSYSCKKTYKVEKKRDEKTSLSQSEHRASSLNKNTKARKSFWSGK